MTNPPAAKKLDAATFVLKILVVVTALEIKALPVTPTVGPPAVIANPPAEKRVAKTFVVETAFEA
jgi:hypothetical protein